MALSNTTKIVIFVICIVLILASGIGSYIAYSYNTDITTVTTKPITTTQPTITTTQPVNTIQPIVTTQPIITTQPVTIAPNQISKCKLCSPGYYACPADLIKSPEWYNNQASLISSYRLAAYDPVTAPITIDNSGYYFRQLGSTCT